jgi:nucleoid DNA-binding protein
MIVKKTQLIREVRKTVNANRMKRAELEGNKEVTLLLKDTVTEVVNTLIDTIELHLKKEESVAISPLGRLEIELKNKGYYNFTTKENITDFMVILRFKSTHLRKYFKEQREQQKEESKDVSEQVSKA